MKSKLFKELIAEQSPRDRYYKRGSAEARSTEAEQARQLRQQTQQSVTDYARQQGLAPSDVINQVKTSSNNGPSYQSPASIPTVKNPGDLPPDVERAAKLLSDPKTNWRELSKPDPVLPPGAVGNIINALPPNIGPVPVRGPATFLRSLITPKVSKPLSVTPEIGIPPPMSRGITSQTSGDIAAGIAKAEKAARDRAGVSGASDTIPTTTSKPATNEPVAPVQGRPAPTSSKPGSNIEISTGNKSPGGSVGTDITGAASNTNKPSSMQQMLDKEIGPPTNVGVNTTSTGRQPAKPPTTNKASSDSVNTTSTGGQPTTNKASSDPTTSTRVEPRLDLDAIDSAIAASKAGTAKDTSTATAPASLRYRDYGHREGMAPRLPQGNVKKANTANELPRGYGQGAMALGISGAGLAALNQPPIASTTNADNRPAPATNGVAPVPRGGAAAAPTPATTTRGGAAAPAASAAGTAAPTAIPLPAPSVANNQQIDAANTRAWVNADPDTRRKIQDITNTSQDRFRSMTGDNRGNAPTAPATASAVSPAGNNKPFTPQDREGGGVGDDVRLRAMQYLSGQRPDASGQMNKNAPGVNPQAWDEKELKNLQTSLPQGQGMTEAIRELKKLSGLIK